MKFAGLLIDGSLASCRLFDQVPTIAFNTVVVFVIPLVALLPSVSVMCREEKLRKFVVPQGAQLPNVV
jgi:hypothetical protein